MRIASLSCLALSLLFPSVISAQSAPRSTVWLSRSVLWRGQQQTMVVTARDLDGQPLPDASVTAALHIGKRVLTYQLAKTNSQGKSHLSFTPPAGVSKAQVAVAITIRRGLLTIPVFTRFAIGQPLARTFGSLLVSVHALPNPAVAPAPVYLFVSAHVPGGQVASGARVAATITFGGTTMKVYGTTGTAGTATLRVDTTKMRMPGGVRVATTATWKSSQGHAGATFVLASPATALPTVTPPPSPSPTPTNTPVPTDTPVPTATLVLTSTPVVTDTPVPTTAPIPTATLVPTVAPVPTSTDVPLAQNALAATAIPTSAPTPVPTDVPVPTITPVPATATPVPTDTPTPTPIPTDTPVPAQYYAPTNTPVPVSTAGCPGTQNGCIQAVLNIINNDRAQYGLPAYSLNMTQSTGSGSCIGSYGHSVHMANEGRISHDDFPADICISFGSIAENVGYEQTGNELQDLQAIDNMMMSEQHTPGCSGNHACNILSPAYRQVGIGIYNSNGITWLTEDFIG